MRHNSIGKNAVLRILLTFFNIAVPLLVAPYLARVLDPELYAIYNQAVSLVAWFVPLATFGIYNYAIREINSLRSVNKDASTLFSKLFIFGVVSTLITAVLYAVIVVISFSGIIRLIYIYFIIEVIAQAFYVEWMNEADENYSFILLKTIFIKILYVVCVFIFVRKPSDILPYTVITALSVFFNYFVSFIFVKRRIKLTKVRFSDLAEMFVPLFVMFLLTNANLLYTYLDRLFLTLFSNKVIYSSYYQFPLSIMTLISQIVNAIIIVTIPRLSTLIGKKDNDSYYKLLNKSVHYYLLLGLPICTGIAVTSNEIILLYSGDKYIAAAPVLFVFAIRTVICLFDRVFASQILFVNGHEKRITTIYFICGGINFVLDVLLTITGNLTPVMLVITTMISEIILIMLEISVIKKYCGKSIHVIDKNVFIYFILSFLFLPIYFVINYFIPFGGVINFRFILRLLVIVLSCVVVYCCGLIFLHDPYVIEFIQSLMKRKREL